MVILPAARRHHRSRTFYAFGLLALLGAVGTLVIVARHPALSATELSAPVPAPEITVPEGPDPDPFRGVPVPAPAEGVDVPGEGTAGRAVPGQAVPGQGTAGQDVPGQDAAGQGTAGQAVPGQGTAGQDVPGQDAAGQGTAGQDAAGRPGAQAGAGAGTGTDPVFEAHRAAGGRTDRPGDVGRSLFWSGLLGLAISLAGLGLVGARRRRW